MRCHEDSTIWKQHFKVVMARMLETAGEVPRSCSDGIDRADK